LFFDSGKAELTVEAKDRLEKLIREKFIKYSTKLQVLLIIGHADNTGDSKANLVLSEKRALAVKDYLIGHGLEPSIIYAESRGDRFPLTGKKCDALRKNKKASKALSACLKPDRRVDVQGVVQYLSLQPKN